MQRKAKNILKNLKRLSLDAQDKLFFRRFGNLVSTIKRDSITQVRLLHGIIIPPHERAILRPLRWENYQEYHLVGGRGVAKSFSMCSMAPVLQCEVTSRKKISSLSASRFRGGKVIMEEAEQLIKGVLDGQRTPAPFGRQMTKYRNIIKRGSDMWDIAFTTNSRMITVPTGNEETARGLRAHWLFLDEADNWEKESVDKVFGPFLAVQTNFEYPGKEGSENKIFFTGTVSYTHKDWAKVLKDRENVIKKRYEAYKEFEKGNFGEFDRMMSEGNERLKYASVYLQRWDYTDLIIPLELENHDVYYPTFNRFTEDIEVNNENSIKYDPRDKKDYIYTYPVNKEFAEKQLDDGLTDFDTWAAEWRCQFIETSGNVYPFELIERATTTELLDPNEASKKGWNLHENGPYFPPLLWECDDPCVLGVDPARTSDFSAFVVIRIGEMGKGNYGPRSGTGNTPWNNVIWAEQRRHMTIRDVSEKIRELKRRYNLVTPNNPTKAPAISIDARGAMAGTTVRDELARPTPNVDKYGNVDHSWTNPKPIYDPTDDEYKELRANNKAWPGLRLLWTSDNMNTELVSFSKGQFETSKLYIAHYISKSDRDDPEDKLNPGYIGCKVLADQLTSIQGVPTKYAYKYEMPGDSRRLEMKKDMFSAFLYACYGLRQHLSLLVDKNKKEPVTAALAVRPGGGRYNLFSDRFKRF